MAIIVKGGFRGGKGAMAPQDAKSCKIIVITVHRVHAQNGMSCYNLPYSQLNKSKTVLLVLFLKPPSSLTPLLFLNLYSGSKVKINQLIEYKILSLRDLHIKDHTNAEPGYLQNLISVDSLCCKS